MKFFAYILCLYLTILTVLPSVKAVKMQFVEKCQSSCQKNNPDNNTSGCEKGKFIMNLNFSPVQFINAQWIQNTSITQLFESPKKENSGYEKVFISKYKNSIWQPPKLIYLA